MLVFQIHYPICPKCQNQNAIVVLGLPAHKGVSKAKRKTLLYSDARRFPILAEVILSQGYELQ